VPRVSVQAGSSS